MAHVLVLYSYTPGPLFRNPVSAPGPDWGQKGHSKMISIIYLICENNSTMLKLKPLVSLFSGGSGSGPEPLTTTSLAEYYSMAGAPQYLTSYTSHESASVTECSQNHCPSSCQVIVYDASSRTCKVLANGIKVRNVNMTNVDGATTYFHVGKAFIIS